MEAFYYICDFANTAIQIWFILQLVGGMFEAKLARKKLYAVQAVLIGAVALMKCANDYLYQVLFSNGILIITAVLMAVAGKLLYKYRFIDGLCIILLGLVTLALIDFFVQTCVCMILDEHDMSKGILMSAGLWRAFYLLVVSFLLLPVGIKVRKWLARWRREAYRYRKQGFFLLFPLLVCMVYFQNIYLLYDSEQLLTHWWIFILACILLCVFFWVYTVKRKTDEEVRIQQTKIEMLESNYLSLQQIYNEKAVLVHDMKNHMYTFRSILERGKLEEGLEYISEITGELEESGNRVWTQHEMLDLILNWKAQEARKFGIVMHCECDDMRGLKLTTMELCALFTNLLDNAIEANERCPEGTEHRIDVECRKRGWMLLVMVQNRMAEHEAAKGMGLLKTTSKKERGHGYGMQSIKKIVDCHGGDVEVNIQKDIFRIDVSLNAFKE